MSQSEDLAVREDTTTQPRFEPALRGYDKRQVDQYVAQTDGEIARLATERERALGQIQEMAAQLARLQVELTELSQRPPQVDRASFRHLGPMVSEILGLAERQAEAITTTTAERAAHRQAEAEKMIADARNQAAQTLRDLEVELAARRADEDRAHEERQTAALTELAEIRKQADKLRAEGAAARDSAGQEAKRIKEQSAQLLKHTQTECAALLEAARAQAQQELAERRAKLEQEINERRTDAGNKIVALHTEAQQHAAEVRRQADQEAADHQQQLTLVQQEIQAQRQALTELHLETDAGEQQLAQSRQERAIAERETTQLQHRLGEVRQELSAELNRLAEARRAIDAAEKHAQTIRARVQREAKRVADLAAAAVMAAAAGGADTGEFPQVTAVLPGADQTADEAAPSSPAAGNLAPAPQTPASGNGHAEHHTDSLVPVPRESQPAEVATDAE